MLALVILPERTNAKALPRHELQLINFTVFNYFNFSLLNFLNAIDDSVLLVIREKLIGNEILLNPRIFPKWPSIK